MSNRLPNLFIVGTVKAGTTSLYTYLNAHPEFSGSSVKETQFFKPKYFDEKSADLSVYREYFEHAANERYVFEASPNYVNGKERLAVYIKKTFPDCKIIILLREPKSRFISFFNHCKDLLLIDKKMKVSDYIDECQRQMRIAPIPEEAQWQALARNSSDTIPPWMDVFGEDLWIGFFEDMKEDPAAFTNSVCAWLDVPPATDVGVTFTIENATIRPASVSFHRLANQVNATLEPVLRRNHTLKRLIRKSYHMVNRSSEKGEVATPEDMARLEAHFAPHNAALLQAFRIKRPWQTNLPPWLRKFETAAS